MPIPSTTVVVRWVITTKEVTAMEVKRVNSGFQNWSSHAVSTEARARFMEKRGGAGPVPAKDRPRYSHVPEKPQLKEEPFCQPVLIETENMETRLRVAAYCRVSTLMDNQETSIDSQQMHYDSLIRSHDDWEPAGIYLEAGVSGTKAENRPELQRLLEDCRQGKVDLILTKSISRFARNTTDCIQMVRTLTGLGVDILFEKENIHTGTMGSEFLLTMLACLAADESKSISDNMKWGIRKRFSDGTYRMGSEPYGYMWLKDQLVIFEDEAEVVRRIFHLALSGNGMSTIAKILNSDHIPSPTGVEWTQPTIRRMLSNPVYKGDLMYQKTYTDDKYVQRENQGELDQYYVTDHHEGIVSKGDFDLTQAAIRLRAEETGHKADKKHSAQHAFSSLLICAECGSVMHRHYWKGKNPTWICYAHTKRPDQCSMKPQSEEELKIGVIYCLNKLAWSQRQRDQERKILDAYEQIQKRRGSRSVKDQLEDINREIEINKQKLKKVTALLAHESNGRQYQNEMARLTQEAQQLRLQRNTLIPQLSSDRQLPEMKDFVNHWEITGDINAFPDKEFSNLVEKCEILTGKSMVIHFNCGLIVTERLGEGVDQQVSADHPGSTDQPAEYSDKPADIPDSCQKAIEHFNEAIECVLSEMQEDVG